nr:Argonaute/Dicer protein, PAZ [Ipomoea batatas]
MTARLTPREATSGVIETCSSAKKWLAFTMHLVPLLPGPGRRGNLIDLLDAGWIAWVGAASGCRDKTWAELQWLDMEAGLLGAAREPMASEAHHQKVPHAHLCHHGAAMEPLHADIAGHPYLADTQGVHRTAEEPFPLVELHHLGHHVLHAEVPSHLSLLGSYPPVDVAVVGVEHLVLLQSPEDLMTHPHQDVQFFSFSPWYLQE